MRDDRKYIVLLGANVTGKIDEFSELNYAVKLNKRMAEAAETFFRYSASQDYTNGPNFYTRPKII